MHRAGHRGSHHRGRERLAFTRPTAILVADMFHPFDLGRNDFQLAPHFLAHFMQRPHTGGTLLLLGGQPVVHPFHGQILEAASRCPRAFFFRV